MIRPISKNKMTLHVCHTVIHLALFTILLTLAGCKQQTNTGEDIQYVRTTIAEDANKNISINYPGKTRSAAEINMSFRVSGPISKIHVKEGQHVNKGQLVASMDPRDYQVQLSATQAEYEQIKADAERIIAMYEEGNTTASNYDKARYGLEQITQKLNNHRNQLADTHIYAPIDGYIQDIIHEAGETVGAGMPVISMFGSGTVEIEVNISAFDYANRERLKNAYCTFDLMPGQTFPLQISSISPEANASQLYTVRLRFTSTYDHKKITPGMSTMVYVDVSNETNGNVSIPTTSIIDEGGEQKVFVYDPSTSIVSKRTVIVKRLHRNGMADIESGLNDGDEVVSAGAHHITDGQKVKPLPKHSPSNIGGLL